MTPYQTEQIRLKGQQLTEAEKALLGADVAELKGLEKQIGGTEEHGYSLFPLHVTSNKAEMDTLRKRASELRQKIQAEYGRKKPELPPGPVPTQTTKRVKVVGPGGRRGTVPEGTKLPEGWQLAK